MVQPSAPGHRVELRHANTLAFCPRTTVRNAAPDAASSSWPVGNGAPGDQPAAAIDTRKASIDSAAMSGPRRPKARRTTVAFISRPVTGGPSSRCRAGGSAPSATAERVSVQRSIARICRTPRASGNRPPDSAHTTKGVSSATLSVRW